MYATLCDADQVIASDSLNHASIIDGLRLSKAKKTIVPHLNPEAIDPSVDAIAIEGLFSMDGDIPDLTRYPRGPILAVDEAHALGCMGPDGRGVAAAQGVTPDIIVGTFGKALGLSGAFVCAPQTFIDLLVNQGRAFIYSTAPSETVLHQTFSNLQRLQRDGEALREQLHARTQQFRDRLRTLHRRIGCRTHCACCSSRSYHVGGSIPVRTGYSCNRVRYPTVAHGEERIRFTVSAAHTPDQINQILDALDRALQQTRE